MKREVIAFAGRQGSGKSFQAARLVKERGFKKLSFADPLREIAFNVIGMNFDEGMEKYAELKQTEIINGLNFRNILENLGASVRKFDKDFWARALVTSVQKSVENIVIDDMRHPNEYLALRNFCATEGISFRAYFCNYKSDVYEEANTHESAAMSNYLAQLGYNDLQLIDFKDICGYIALTEKDIKSFKEVQPNKQVNRTIKDMGDELIKLLKG